MGDDHASGFRVFERASDSFLDTNEFIEKISFGIKRGQHSLRSAEGKANLAKSKIRRLLKVVERRRWNGRTDADYVDGLLRGLGGDDVAFLRYQPAASAHRRLCSGSEWVE